MAGFGLENLGLLALRFPRATLLALVAITASLLFGAVNVEYSSDSREIFQSDTPEFALVEEVTSQYPGSEQEILLMVEGLELFTPGNLERLRTAHLDLTLIDGVRYVLSMFSARRPPDANGQIPSVIPDEAPQTDNLAALQQELLRHPLVKGKLLSQDGQMSLFVVALDSEMDVPDLRRIAAEIRTITDGALEGSGLKTDLTGLAYMRIEIIDALFRDQRNFTIAGLLMSVILCWLFFRKISYVLIACTPAVAAVIWLLGSMQLRGQEVNVLTSIVPALVMVIVFADALHLLFAVRRNLEAGKSLHEAITASVVDVGPACVLTSITTTLALLTLMLVPHAFIAGFGLTAAMGTMIAYVATMTTVPMLSYFLLGKAASEGSPKPQPDRAIGAIAKFCNLIVGSALTWPRTVVFAGVLLAVSAGAFYSLTKPSYSYKEYLPRENPSYLATERIDKKLAGTETLQLLIQWPKDHKLEAPETLNLIRDAHLILEESEIVKEVWSLHSVESWLTSGGSGQQDVFRFLADTDSPLNTRIVSLENNSALVTGHFPSADAAILLPILKKLETRLAQLGEDHKDVRLLLSGWAAVSATASHKMIAQLNRSLLTAICVIIVLIGLALRSAKAGLISILPNLLPIAVGGAFLYLTGRGLQFSSVIAFTIGFGIAVDSTIHVLSRFRSERQAGRTIDAALTETMAAVGPVLIVGTTVLASGLGSTLLSELPTLRLFGEISILLLVTALLFDLVLLPCIVAVVEGRWPSNND